jgi:hypothetical protein
LRRNGRGQGAALFKDRVMKAKLERARRRRQAIEKSAAHLRLL